MKWFVRPGEGQNRVRQQGKALAAGWGRQGGKAAGKQGQAGAVLGKAGKGKGRQGEGWAGGSSRQARQALQGKAGSKAGQGRYQGKGKAAG